MSSPTDPTKLAIKCYLATNEYGVHVALNELIYKKHSRIKAFGLDCEWDVVHEKGKILKPDLLQIAASDGFCGLIRLNLIKSIPSRLREFLRNPVYLKVGVGVLEDAQKLQESFQVSTKSILDLRHLADKEGVDPRGLSQLSQSVLGVPCEKQHFSFHQWTRYLSENQKVYAAKDAVNSAKIFDKLNHAAMLRTWGPKCESWGEPEYTMRTFELWREYIAKPFEYSKSKYFIGKLVDSVLRLSTMETSEIIN